MENSILSDDFWQDMPGTFVALGSESDRHEAGVHTGSTVDVRWKSPVEKLSLGPWGFFFGAPNFETTRIWSICTKFGHW